MLTVRGVPGRCTDTKVLADLTDTVQAEAGWLNITTSGQNPAQRGQGLISDTNGPYY